MENILKIEMRYPDVWTSLIRTSFGYYTNECQERICWISNAKLPEAVLLIRYNNLSIVIDCKDSPEIESNLEGNFYFKRSAWKGRDYGRRILPLGFTFPCYYKYLSIIFSLLKQKQYLSQLSPKKLPFIELIRQLDRFNLFTNTNSNIRNPEGYMKKVFARRTLAGPILYKTRLWNPKTARTKEKKEQREIQCSNRINWVKYLHKNFPNVKAGIQNDEFSRSMVDKRYLLDTNSASLRQHFVDIATSSICIADDGLEDTLGWRIGEYVWFGKPIVTTPINIALPGNFEDGKNYIGIDKLASESEFVDKIKLINQEIELKEMSNTNKKYAEDLLYNSKIAQRILSKITLN